MHAAPRCYKQDPPEAALILKANALNFVIKSRSNPEVKPTVLLGMDIQHMNMLDRQISRPLNVLLSLLCWYVRSACSTGDVILRTLWKEGHGLHRGNSEYLNSPTDTQDTHVVRYQQQRQLEANTHATETPNLPIWASAAGRPHKLSRAVRCIHVTSQGTPIVTILPRVKT